MDTIDTIVFGDNQFFGINHMSQEKAQQLAEKFFDIENIYNVYRLALDAGVRAVMLNSNDRAKEICEHFRDNASKYPSLNWYPSIPYPHKYANLVAEKGIFPAINEVLFKDNSARKVMGMITKGSAAVVTKDAVKLMQLLIDVEMKMFKGLDVKVVFLQNIITDLILGYGLMDIFYEYCEYIRKKYDALPGLITQNMPYLKQKFEDWGITKVVICASYNKIGYLMSPDVESYEKAAQQNNPYDYQLMAMSTLASGAVPAREAYDFINQQNLQSVVFGASSKRNIDETVSLINLAG
ncbi:hypothetical protein OO006_02955 [Prosthecochloris sp. SCSIO W1101]|uniref:hypothetical protein n=1 Tax=Prosthecochloris sp. SCSIO W1101 TaxID=2992242 RepID=UPI00223D7F50|nr:hypothetical protein [Prosthecochloris sp. SCSIO W1101]UZJ41972.1 hypothetical protein OO006_02955 [Prosthecochloris sp. SCSIO W1101]